MDHTPQKEKEIQEFWKVEEGEEQKMRLFWEAMSPVRIRDGYDVSEESSDSEGAEELEDPHHSSSSLMFYTPDTIGDELKDEDYVEDPQNLLAPRITFDVQQPCLTSTRALADINLPASSRNLTHEDEDENKDGDGDENSSAIRNKWLYGKIARKTAGFW
jgi:hypothetical protein